LSGGLNYAAMPPMLCEASAAESVRIVAPETLAAAVNTVVELELLAGAPRAKYREPTGVRKRATFINIKTTSLAKSPRKCVG
jgi:hypothetical protein